MRTVILVCIKPREHYTREGDEAPRLPTLRHLPNYTRALRVGQEELPNEHVLFFPQDGENLDGGGAFHAESPF